MKQKRHPHAKKVKMPWYKCFSIADALLYELLAILDKDALGVLAHTLTSKVVDRSVGVELLGCNVVDACLWACSNDEVANFPCSGSLVRAYILEAYLYSLALISSKADGLSLEWREALAIRNSRIVDTCKLCPVAVLYLDPYGSLCFLVAEILGYGMVEIQVAYYFCV